MIWMALLMGLPVLGLVLFAIYSWQIALVPYLVLVAVSVFFDYLMIRAMRLPGVTGRKEMIGSRAMVVDWPDDEGRVNWKGEIWRARTCDDKAPSPGEVVLIESVSRLLLFVKSAHSACK